MEQPVGQGMNADDWEARKRASVRLAWKLAAVAVALFALAIWKYRPL